MTSWYSNLLTKTSSQISNLRATLLASEADGDTEDDTHVCRVLRNYYTDKGRPLPPWLPPDPKSPAPTPAPMYAQVGNAGPPRGYGSLGGGGGALDQRQGSVASGGGLSSLWDAGPAGGGGAPQAPASLRAGRMGRGRDEGPARPPLPSQRAGSYQNTSSTGPPTSGGPGGPGGASSAQDRLKQRLWGGSRTASPQGGSSGPFQPPPTQSFGGGGGAPAGGRGGDNYEDRYAPGGTYDVGRGADRQYQPPAPGGPRRQGMMGNQRGYR